MATENNIIQFPAAAQETPPVAAEYTRLNPDEVIASYIDVLAAQKEQEHGLRPEELRVSLQGLLENFNNRFKRE